MFLKENSLHEWLKNGPIMSESLEENSLNPFVFMDQIVMVSVFWSLFLWRELLQKRLKFPEWDHILFLSGFLILSQPLSAPV
jgi:hypothetical protein